MLKVAIFDDEFIVIEGLKKMIDWSKYGMELVGTAKDGNSALSLFHSEHPDIIFTDIRMPGIDGLQLIEKVLAEAPETKCIVFSGFNEFEYVRRAIRLGVIDYLEKPITIPMIEEALQKITLRINQEKEMSELRLRWDRNRQELLQKATLDLLLEGKEAITRWRESFGDEAKQVIGITVIAISGERPSLQLNASFKAVPVWNGTTQILVLFHFENNPEQLSELLIEWSEQEEVTIGSGQTYLNITDISKSYREALHALRYGRFLDSKGWTRFEEVGKNNKIPEDLSAQEEAILYYMRTGNKEGLLGQLDKYIQWLDSQKLNPDMMESEFLKLVYLGMEVVKETGEETQQTGYYPQKDIRELNTREEMTTWLYSQMEMMIELINSSKKSNKHKAVEKAKEYMEKNYHQDITLQEVADLVGMNPNYFSLLFKEEMGLTYIKYLTKCRMEKAKVMLKEGQKISEVSEKVGYLTYRHFSEVFKKYTGMTPGQFKENK
ncbi:MULTISPECIES: response regulator [Metabacillus]|uniref:DNA-binding response regulator n=2 Tax=Metabacillus TaxID=2675233 RepID=A0A179SMI6_9BACI|nr:MULTISPECIES: response regulator [Metabacillus]OAS82584.1 DNA-binding response regulator [Metabacillus litoralis]QNF26770.1 response regulator [Metabacillus sp. KUDC1714]